jgi:peptidoglycan/xylan/chitin deacetylase (PgdA/CDA1 family)
VKSIISLTFDDGLRCQFERAVPVLNSVRLPATFFLIANRNSTHDLWSGHSDDWWKIDWRAADIGILKTLIREGHEIGSHSVSHDPVNLKIPEQSEFEARESKRLIEGWIGAPLSSFCYPFYWSHAYLADAVKKVRISAGARRRSGTRICAWSVLLRCFRIRIFRSIQRGLPTDFTERECQ